MMMQMKIKLTKLMMKMMMKLMKIMMMKRMIKINMMMKLVKIIMKMNAQPQSCFTLLLDQESKRRHQEVKSHPLIVFLCCIFILICICIL